MGKRYHSWCSFEDRDVCSRCGLRRWKSSRTAAARALDAGASPLQVLLRFSFRFETVYGTFTEKRPNCIEVSDGEEDE
jgi:hypothetical protein